MLLGFNWVVGPERSEAPNVTVGDQGGPIEQNGIVP